MDNDGFRERYVILWEWDKHHDPRRRPVTPDLTQSIEEICKYLALRGVRVYFRQVVFSDAKPIWYCTFYVTTRAVLLRSFIQYVNYETKQPRRFKNRFHPFANAQHYDKKQALLDCIKKIGSDPHGSEPR